MRLPEISQLDIFPFRRLTQLDLLIQTISRRLQGRSVHTPASFRVDDDVPGNPHATSSCIVTEADAE
jgi:hypothetical protein